MAYLVNDSFNRKVIGTTIKLVDEKSVKLSLRKACRISCLLHFCFTNISKYKFLSSLPSPRIRFQANVWQGKKKMTNLCFEGGSKPLKDLVILFLDEKCGKKGEWHQNTIKNIQLFFFFFYGFNIYLKTSNDYFFMTLSEKIEYMQIFSSIC